MKLLLDLAASQQWKLAYMDIQNAFLNGDLYEEVYMALPLEYEPRGELSTYGGKLVF